MITEFEQDNKLAMTTLDFEQIKKIFETCADLSDSDFWADIFTDCAEGNFPKGMRCAGDILYIRGIKGQPQTINLANQDVNEIYEKILDCMKNVLHITDPNDENEKMEDFENRMTEKEAKIKDQEWSKVKDKNKKFIFYKFIEKVILDAGIKFDVTICRRLYQDISEMLSTKRITGDNIVFEDGYIVNIDGVAFDPDTLSWDVEIAEKKKKKIESSEKKSIENISTVSISDVWTRYLKSLVSQRKLVTTLKSKAKRAPRRKK